MNNIDTMKKPPELMKRAAVSPPDEEGIKGPRTQITLDIAEEALPVLLQGVPAVEVRLCRHTDGTYTLHGLQTIVQARRRDEEPVADVLVKCLNDIGRAINNNLAMVPLEVVNALDQAIERYQVRNGRAN